MSKFRGSSMTCITRVLVAAACCLSRVSDRYCGSSCKPAMVTIQIGIICTSHQACGTGGAGKLAACAGVWHHDDSRLHLALWASEHLHIEALVHTPLHA